MLYLIRTFGRNKKSALKVGWTGNIGDRKKVYYSHNPFYELVSVREGNEFDEIRIQMYLESYGLKADFLDEWFKDDPKVYTLFHERSLKIDRRIWFCRDYLFRLSDKKRLRIYENLRMRFGVHKEKEIDRAWRIRSSKAVIESIKRKYF